MLITDHLKDRNASERNLGRPAEPRVLIADDQADVLEALRLLLKAEGFHLETASSPAGVLAALEAREFDVALIDLNYARDTTSGEEGLNLLSRIQGLDPTLPWVQGGSSVHRRTRFHPEAMGQREAAGHHPHPDRAEPGVAEGPASRGGKLTVARRGHAEAHR